MEPYPKPCHTENRMYQPQKAGVSSASQLVLGAPKRLWNIIVSAPSRSSRFCMIWTMTTDATKLGRYESIWQTRLYFLKRSCETSSAKRTGTMKPIVRLSPPIANVLRSASRNSLPPTPPPVNRYLKFSHPFQGLSKIPR